MFTSKDKDNDLATVNCAEETHGAWWWGEYCNVSNLNGMYLGTNQTIYDGVYWYTFYSYGNQSHTDYYHPLKKTEIKVRPGKF